MTTTPRTTSKVSSNIPKISNQHGKKRKISPHPNDADDVVGPEPAGDDEQMSLPAKRGRASPKSQKQATSCPISAPIGKGSRAKATATATETRNGVGSEDNIAHRARAKRPNVANDDSEAASDSGIPHRAAKKAKPQGLRCSGTLPNFR
jgi:hypothetical protein